MIKFHFRMLDKNTQINCQIKRKCNSWTKRFNLYCRTCLKSYGFTKQVITLLKMMRKGIFCVESLKLFNKTFIKMNFQGIETRIINKFDQNFFQKLGKWKNIYLNAFILGITCIIPSGSLFHLGYFIGLLISCDKWSMCFGSNILYKKRSNFDHIFLIFISQDVILKQRIWKNFHLIFNAKSSQNISNVDRLKRNLKLHPNTFQKIYQQEMPNLP